MKTKDLVIIGAVALLGVLFLRKKPSVTSKQDELPNGGTSSTDKIPNGGLNLPKNMDLPNLTPIPKGGLTTEEGLNNSNVKPLIKEDPIVKQDNEPTQIFLNELPSELKPKGVSTIVADPIDVIVPAPIDPIIEEIERNRLYQAEIERNRLYQEEIERNRLYQAEIERNRLYQEEIERLRRQEGQIERNNREAEIERNRLYEEQMERIRTEEGTNPTRGYPIYDYPTPVSPRSNYITEDVIDYLSNRTPNEPTRSDYITQDVINYLSNVKPNETSNVVNNSTDLLPQQDDIDYLANRILNGSSNVVINPIDVVPQQPVYSTSQSYSPIKDNSLSRDNYIYGNETRYIEEAI